MNTYSIRFSFLVLLSLMIFSCGNDDDTIIEPSYEIPSTYNFDNVSYTGQSHRLAMMTEWKNYMAKSQVSGVALDTDVMKAMFANAEGAVFSQEYTKQIKSKTFEPVQADFESLVEELALASQSTVIGSEGSSGVIASLDGEKSYLVGDDGLDHAQVIEKGLMGACFYYQATSVYLGSERMNVDNETIIDGEGTAMEHHWDEAFGYFGVTKDFPSNLDILFFWANYSNKGNSILGSNQKMMDAFLKGRAAISNQDMASRDEAIATLRSEWEKIAVGAALHYLNEGIANFDDMALRSHSLSEAIGFIYGLLFNSEKIIPTAQIEEILTHIAGSEDFENMNLYNTSITNLQAAKDNLATWYSLEDVKNDF